MKDNTIRAIVRQLISERVMSDVDGEKLIAQRCSVCFVKERSVHTQHACLMLQE